MPGALGSSLHAGFWRTETTVMWSQNLPDRPSLIRHASGSHATVGPIPLVFPMFFFFLADVTTKKEILHTFRAVKMHYRVLARWSVFRAHEGED